MRKLALLVLTLCLVIPSCSAGPHQLNRTVDDWDQEMYVDSPWLNGALHFIPVIPIAHFVAGIGDFFITDAYSFWFKDAWDGKGTGFTHYKVNATDGAMKSLLIDDAKFLEVK